MRNYRTERAALRAILRAQDGVISRMAAALDDPGVAASVSFACPISRQGLALHLARHGLLRECAEARARAMIGTTRSQLAAGVADPERERERVLEAIAAAPTRAAAARKLGMGQRTLTRRLRAFGLTGYDQTAAP